MSVHLLPCINPLSVVLASGTLTPFRALLNRGTGWSGNVWYAQLAFQCVGVLFLYDARFPQSSHLLSKWIRMSLSVSNASARLPEPRHAWAWMFEYIAHEKLDVAPPESVELPEEKVILKVRRVLQMSHSFTPSVVSHFAPR